MCVFAMFLFYLLVVVGTQAAVTRDHYLHDRGHDMRRQRPHHIRGVSLM